jgi:hypothetical protein
VKLLRNGLRERLEAAVVSKKQEQRSEVHLKYFKTNIMSSLVDEGINMDMDMGDNMEDVHDVGTGDVYDTNDVYMNNDEIVLGGTTTRPWYKRSCFKLCGMITFVVLVILAISVPVMNSKNATASSSGMGSEPFVFVPELPEKEVQSNKQAFNAVLLEYYKSYQLDWESVLEESSPQAKALEWVAGSQSYNQLDRARRVQRYALGVFYYSTFKQPHDYYNQDKGGEAISGWTSSVKWMSHENECDWEGVTCEGAGVTGILLREHNLSGVLPKELAFLSNLATLDLTTNYIFVDGEENVTPFTHLDKLKTLLMEDNYVVTTDSGLPPSFGFMTDLEKVSLSYNILQGPLDGSIFTKLTKLTHLETESNFLMADLPKELLQSPTMVYLYLRRNLLDIDLPRLLESTTLPGIFAIWLDSNRITGTIPSSMADHTDLASFSITNTTLAGSIPSELGQLTGLRRVWLYKNQLTGSIPDELSNLGELEVLELYDNSLGGSMPQGVCDNVDNSEYEFKELSVDCDKVACDCCTECY